MDKTQKIAIFCFGMVSGFVITELFVVLPLLNLLGEVVKTF